MVNRRRVTWAIGLIAAMYYGTLFYWQKENLLGDSVDQVLRDRAILGIVLAILYVDT